MDNNTFIINFNFPHENLHLQHICRKPKNK
uniref:Uncharacterized protein n=1 Tax=Rhizophora mucronata TaxID=61149 RepID=A0A2P2PS13_RHIMU